MAGRKGELPGWRQVQIGGAVCVARDDGVPWKALEERYGRGRVQLWRYVQAFRAKMKQNSAKMKHQHACLLSDAA